MDWNNIFDAYGEKLVTKTDKAKDAYVLNTTQLAALAAAGVTPKRYVEFGVTVLFDASVSSIRASYYNSERSPAAGRRPEPRMGGPFINSWLKQGDRVLIGSVGNEVFALKLSTVSVTEEVAILELTQKASKQTILDRAKQAKGKPARRTTQRDDFVRNLYVVAGALLRANGQCEMPACTSTLFLKDDGKNYLEVHHVTPLGENGDDSLANAAALCPHCHRKLHFGKDRSSFRGKLATHISSLKI